MGRVCRLWPATRLAHRLVCIRVAQFFRCRREDSTFFPQMIDYDSIMPALSKPVRRRVLIDCEAHPTLRCALGVSANTGICALQDIEVSK